MNYVYVSTGKSRDVQRDAPYGARAAVHYPELGRTVELYTDANGNWTVSDRPAPGHGGPVHEVASGRLVRDDDLRARLVDQNARMRALDLKED